MQASCSVNATLCRVLDIITTSLATLPHRQESSVDVQLIPPAKPNRSKEGRGPCTVAWSVLRMGQILSAMQAYANVMWASLTGPARPALAGQINPKIRALMDGYQGGKRCAPGSMMCKHSSTRKSSARKWCDVPAAVPRQVLTSASIQQLQKVKNIRDLAEVCSGIAPGILQTIKSCQLTDIRVHQLSTLHAIKLQFC